MLSSNVFFLCSFSNDWWILARSSAFLLSATVVVVVVVVVQNVVVIIWRRATVSAVIFSRRLGKRFNPSPVLVKLDRFYVPYFLLVVGIVQRSTVSVSHQLIQRVSSFRAHFIELFRRSQFEHPKGLRRASGRFPWPHFVSSLPLRGFNGR